MTSCRLIIRSLLYYWRTNIGILLGSAITTAVIVGALVVGDSVRYSLKNIAISRLGKVQLAIDSKNRYFRTELLSDLKSDLGEPIASALLLHGIAINTENSLRANNVQVFGIKENFWKFRINDVDHFDTDLDENYAIINERLAKKIGAKINDEILLRVEKTGLIPLDAPMSLDADLSASLRLTIKSITPENDIGSFGFQVSQIAPLNVFVSLDLLGKKIDLPGKSNVLLIGNEHEVSSANKLIKKHWQLADADLEVREIPDQNAIELRTGRIFLEPVVTNIALENSKSAYGVLTYFVNEIRVGNKKTPYSIVSAIDPEYVDNIKDNEIIINEWLANDLSAKPGDIIELKYFVFSDNRKLEEKNSKFYVRKIVEMKGIYADKTLMPDFPGLADSENCRDWKPAIPIDLNKIRKKDEEYWDLYRGTPKAIISLKKGQELWGNRFGNLTAIRFPIQDNSKTSIELAIKQNLDPSSFGLFFQPIRERILSSSKPSTDFGQLFLSLSVFLIFSASLLSALLFVFNVQNRHEEIGILLASGFSSKQIRRLFLLEGGIITILASFLGIWIGVFYTKIVIYALSTIWRPVVGTSSIRYYASPITLLIGALSGIIISFLAIRLIMWKQTKRSARELLNYDYSSVGLSNYRSRLNLFVGLLLVIVALAIIAFSSFVKIDKNLFFLSSGFLLFGGFAISFYLISILPKLSKRLTLRSVSIGNSSRRPGRSIAIIIMLAFGSFLVIALGANRQNPMENAEERSSGTGGFALYGESTLPIVKNIKENKDISYNVLKDTSFVQFRVYDGDDASCLNLNRVQKPRLLGVSPEELDIRKAFTFKKSLSENSFFILNESTEDDIVNAIGDDSTVTWGLGMSIGDTIPYTDEKGNTFNIRIAGTIANSILQGSFIIAEKEFIKRFPSISGYRMFLIDTPFGNAEGLSSELARYYEDYGLELTKTTERLAEFNAVQNTYLSIFQMLGGLAMIIGSLGLGVVVMRNVMERRNELAILRAIGFSGRSVQWFVINEHWFLLSLGLAIGVISGIISVLPVLKTPGTNIPYQSLTLTILFIFFSGILWIWLSTKLALKGSLLSALRNE